MKKVLIVSTYSSKEVSGTANTLNNLFRGVPGVEILWLCLSFDTNKKCNESPKTVVIDRKFAKLNYIVWKRRWGDRPNRKPNNAENRENINCKNKYLVKDFLKGILDVEPININSPCFEEIDCFLPDVIYTVGGSIQVLKTAYFLSLKYEAGVIVHFMDFWLDTLYKNSFIFKPFRKLLFKYCRMLNQRTAINFAISEPLALEMQKKYQRQYQTLMNPAIDIVDSAETHNRTDGLVFVYGGSLSLNRLENLGVTASFVKSDNINNQIIAYLPMEQITENVKDYLGGCGAEVHQYLPYDEIRKIYSQSDVLLIAAPMGDINTKFAKYSLSTKVPEYMAMGKPILIYSPDKQYLADYVKENAVGIVAETEQDLIDGIKALHSYKCRQNLASAGVKCAKEKHSKESANRKLSNAISKAGDIYKCNV